MVACKLPITLPFVLFLSIIYSWKNIYIYIYTNHYIINLPANWRIFNSLWREFFLLIKEDYCSLGGCRASHANTLNLDPSKFRGWASACIILIRLSLDRSPWGRETLRMDNRYGSTIRLVMIRLDTKGYAALSPRSLTR